MKALVAILVTAVAVVAGCGANDAATDAGEKDSGAARSAGERDPGFPTVSNPDDPRFATLTGGKGRRAELEVDPSNRPPPETVLARDVEMGSGPPVRIGDRVVLFYKGVDYKTGETRFSTWPPTAQPYVLEIRPAEFSDAWEEAIVGMRAGGRRELLTPSRLAFDEGAVDYVFDVIRIEPAAGAPPGG
jgi:peptidylprolyl isomerase